MRVRKDLEQIIGIGQDSMGYTAAVLLTPTSLGDPPNPPAVPEPTSIACALGILAAVIGRRMVAPRGNLIR